jgi:hypothetical protein
MGFLTKGAGRSGGGSSRQRVGYRAPRDFGLDIREPSPPRAEDGACPPR